MSSLENARSWLVYRDEVVSEVDSRRYRKVGWSVLAVCVVLLVTTLTFLGGHSGGDGSWPWKTLLSLLVLTPLGLGMVNVIPVPRFLLLEWLLTGPSSSFDPYPDGSRLSDLDLVELRGDSRTVGEIMDSGVGLGDDHSVVPGDDRDDDPNAGDRGAETTVPDDFWD